MINLFFCGRSFIFWKRKLSQHGPALRTVGISVVWQKIVSGSKWFTVLFRWKQSSWCGMVWLRYLIVSCNVRVSCVFHSRINAMIRVVCLRLTLSPILKPLTQSVGRTGDVTLSHFLDRSGAHRAHLSLYPTHKTLSHAHTHA